MAGRTVPPAVLHELSGAHLENIVLHHLMCWREGRVEHTEILYWRTTTGDEVDFVIETGGRVLPIEIKARSRLRLAYAATLRAFRTEYGTTSRAGLLLHTVETFQ
jgi:predicted AAA+ superfamily ATPase